MKTGEIRSGTVYRDGFRKKRPIREVGASVEEKERRSSQLICANGCTLLALLQRALTGIAISQVTLAIITCVKQKAGLAGGMTRNSQGIESVRRGNE